MSIISNLLVCIIFLTLAQFSQVFSSDAAAAITKDAAATQDTNFTFLVTGGYRPEKHTLAKYLVSLRKHKHREYFGDDHFCGGCIIGPRIILTAAHCLTAKQRKSTPIDAQDVRVVAKTTNRLVQTSDTLMLSVEVIRMHPSYDPKTKANDIGIVKLEDDIEMDGILAAIIPLANKPSVPETHCTVIGWGRILENGPLAADAIYVDVEIWENTFCSFYEKYAKGMLCVGNWEDSELDACAGDSGGPLICESKLVGLVSFGRGCAAGIPGVYTDVWYHRKWIAENKCNSDVVGSRYLILFVTFILMLL